MERLKVIATVINDLHFDQRMIRICSSLVKFGYDVTLVGRRKSEQELPEQTFDQVRMNIPVKSGPLFYLWYNIRLFIELMASRFDIVHAVDLDTLPAASWAAKLKGKKLVYDAHEYFTEVPELQDQIQKKKIWKRVERTYVPKANACITVGPQLARLFQEEYDIPFEVVMNAPVSKELQAGTDHSHRGRFILYQGALNKGRGLELLIDSMIDIDASLVIAGSGDLDDKLKARVESNGVGEKVHFTGMLKPAELQSLTSQAHIGFNISENLGLSYYYSLNNKFFDYIHAGVPSVTNKFPEYEVLNEKFDCCLLADHTRDSLVKAVLLLLNDQNFYDKLKKNCFLASRELNWGVEEKKLEAVYAGIS